MQKEFLLQKFIFTRKKKRKADYEKKCILMEEANHERKRSIAEKLIRTSMKRRVTYSSKTKTPVVLRKVRKYFTPLPEARPQKRCRLSKCALSISYKRPHSGDQSPSSKTASDKRNNHDSVGFPAE